MLFKSSRALPIHLKATSLTKHQMPFFCYVAGPDGKLVVPLLEIYRAKLLTQLQHEFQVWIQSHITSLDLEQQKILTRALEVFRSILKVIVCMEIALMLREIFNPEGRYQLQG